jgi:flagellar protein FlgJ
MQILSAAMQLEHAKQAGNTASPQLRQAANGFEASFLQELLKPMSEDAMFGGANSDSTGSMGTVSSMAAQALADGIAKDGGLGIAKRVLAELAPVEAKQSGNTGLASGTKCGGCAPQLPSVAAPSLDSPELDKAMPTTVPLSPFTQEDFTLSSPITGQNVDQVVGLSQEMY